MTLPELRIDRVQCEQTRLSDGRFRLRFSTDEFQLAEASCKSSGGWQGHLQKIAARVKLVMGVGLERPRYRDRELQVLNS